MSFLTKYSGRLSSSVRKYFIPHARCQTLSFFKLSFLKEFADFFLNFHSFREAAPLSLRQAGCPRPIVWFYLHLAGASSSTFDNKWLWWQMECFLFLFERVFIHLRCSSSSLLILQITTEADEQTDGWVDGVVLSLPCVTSCLRNSSLAVSHSAQTAASLCWYKSCHCCLMPTSPSISLHHQPCHRLMCSVYGTIDLEADVTLLAAFWHFWTAPSLSTAFPTKSNLLHWLVYLGKSSRLPGCLK